MTLAGLRQRLNELCVRVPLMWRGLPHGFEPHVDIDRRLTRTTIKMVFDVGANRGQSARTFRYWYPQATIHCFEPVPTTFRILQTAVSRWPQVQTHQIGFSGAAGQAPIALPTRDDQAHLNLIEGDALIEMVELDTLDAFCLRHGVSHIDYLKIDTEGHDLAVLQGGASLLAEGAAAIVEVEAGMNPDNHFHASAESLTQCLAQHGYRLFGFYEQVLEWPTAEAFLRRANLVFVSPDTIRRNHWVG
jgi:FkbM family methyltransferase